MEMSKREETGCHQQLSMLKALYLKCFLLKAVCVTGHEIVLNIVE